MISDIIHTIALVHLWPRHEKIPRSTSDKLHAYLSYTYILLCRLLCSYCCMQTVSHVSLLNPIHDGLLIASPTLSVCSLPLFGPRTWISRSTATHSNNSTTYFPCGHRTLLLVLCTAVAQGERQRRHACKLWNNILTDVVGLF